MAKNVPNFKSSGLGLASFVCLKPVHRAGFQPADLELQVLQSSRKSVLGGELSGLVSSIFRERC